MSKRLEYLQEVAHDHKIELLTSYKNGKTFTSTKVAGQICELIEEIVKELRKISELP
jgi:hypothetical protein